MADVESFMAVNPKPLLGELAVVKHTAALQPVETE